MRDVDTIKERLSITELIGAYIKLESAGSSYKACCPFHHEKTASFHVTPGKNMYYCFGCGRGGDIFDFVQEIESLDFYSTLKLLAERAGVTLSGKQEGNSQAVALYQILDEAARLYEITFRKEKDVVAYLSERGVSKDSLIQWRVGYAPAGWSFVTEYLKKKGYKDKDLVDAGLSIVGKKGLYDRFRERIMFPIADTQGRVVAFSGRIFTKSDSKTDITKTGKYVNTNDTILYDKSKVLYGYHLAKRAIMANDRIVVTEGQLDLIMSHQAGIAETVAISGTALTQEQVHLIERFTDHVILAFDGDDAGIAAVTRSLVPLFSRGMYVSVVTLPKGEDPADIVQKDPARWVAMVNSATDYFTFRLGILTEEGGDGRAKQKVVHSDLYPLLLSIANMLYLDKIIQQVARVLGVSDDSVRSDFQNWKKNTETPRSTPPSNTAQEEAPKKAEAIDAESRLIGLLLWLESQPDRIVDSEHIRKNLEEHMQESLQSRYESDKQIYDIAITILSREIDESVDIQGLLQELMDKVTIMHLQKRLAITKRALQGTLSVEETESLMGTLNATLREIDTLKTKLSSL
ncbi:MAG: DNA primase [Planctomycetota bacterium]|jgi:DNA primase